MEQSNASAWESGHNDLASTDELPQAPDWLLDEVGPQPEGAEASSDTIPSPPPDEEDVGRLTIPAPPPVGEIPTEE